MEDRKGYRILIGFLTIIACTFMFSYMSGNVICATKSKNVSLSKGQIKYKYKESGTKSVTIKCDYDCKVIIDSINSDFLKIDKKKLKAGTSKLKVTIDSKHINPDEYARNVRIIIMPICNNANKYAKVLTVSQKGHGYTKKIMVTKKDTVGGWGEGIGVFSYSYSMSYIGYYKESSDGKKRIFGKHLVHTCITSSKLSERDLGFSQPAFVIIKNGKGKQVAKYALKADYPGGNGFLHTGDEIFKSTRVAYKKKKFSADTDCVATSGFVTLIGGWTGTGSVKASLNK